MSSSNVASWPAYRFLGRQVKWSGIPISKNFPVCHHSHSQRLWCSQQSRMLTAFSLDTPLELSCFFNDPTDVGNLISGSSAFYKSSLNIWNFMVHILLKPGLENFEHYFAIMWDECNCEVVWTFFGIAILWDWNENWPFPGLWPLLFPKFAGILSAALSQHHLSGFEIAQLESPLALFIAMLP